MDTNRYADLVNMYANNVYKIAVSYCNNRSDAEDIVQNVFIKLLKSKEKFKDDEHVKRWLIRVAINESKNMNTSFCENELFHWRTPNQLLIQGTNLMRKLFCWELS